MPTAHLSFRPQNRLTRYQAYLNDVGPVQTVDTVHPKDAPLLRHLIVIRDPQVSTRAVNTFDLRIPVNSRLSLKCLFLFYNKFSDVLVSEKRKDISGRKYNEDKNHPLHPPCFRVKIVVTIAAENSETRKAITEELSFRTPRPVSSTL